ncbi:MAG: HAD-IIB family hydrolase [Bacteriovoracia bacterium]
MKTTPWEKVKKAELKGIRGVCLDIDDTLSTEGKLTSEAYEALWRLKAAGFWVVPITGRPAGWCDHFARFWPVDAIVGENGAFTFYMEGGVRRRMDTPGSISRVEAAERFEKLERAILSRFPHAKWASDQAYREYDLAIDFCEDVPAWPERDIDELVAICEREGAHAKISSIHVNTWFGDVNKLTGFHHWLKNAAGSGRKKSKPPKPDAWLFIGDSPNDEPMFASFANTVGVANLKKYLKRLKTPPRWITSQKSGAGFVQMADRLLR